MGMFTNKVLKIFFLRNPYRLSSKCNKAYHFCPYRDKKGILTKSFLDKINKRYSGDV